MILRVFLWLLCLSVVGAGYTLAQRPTPVLRVNGSQLSMRVDTTFYPKRWSIDPKLKPDVFEVLVPGKPVRVAFIAETDSIVRHVKAGETIDFVVLTATGDSAFTQIRGLRFVEPAVFSQSYVSTHRGRTFVEIPDVYELVNIVFALTEAAQKNNDLARKNTAYYDEVRTFFTRYKNEPIVTIIDSILTKDESNYFPLKMDAFAFGFDKNGRISQSPVYDRVSWGRENTLRSYVPLLQAFAKKSNFLQFYNKQRPYYDRLIRAYQDSLDVAGMQTWLNRNFPTTRYDSFKIIFSPLVSGNQSACWFANNGFREAQAHVNFPFPSQSDADFSAKAVNVRKGNIVFTELNHAFINPEAEKPRYQQALRSAFAKLDTWIDRSKPAKNYDNLYACFEEYINWAMVSLRYVDVAPESERAALLKGIETMMVDRRGFKRFAEFSQFIVPLYQNRPRGATVADLYPQIVRWFEDHKS